MHRALASMVLGMALFPALSHGQECKLKFSVAYNDGKTLQIGLTHDQKKMWDHDGAKKFKGMCPDDKAPNYIIIWSDGMNGAELAKASLDHFNVVRTTGEYAGTSIDLHGSLSANTLQARPSSMVRGKAEYLIFDTSKTPFAVIRQGQGYQDVPQGATNRPGEKASVEDIASTIADPVAALENALKWLKKDKKL